ncbi:MAG: SPOR domain-containing protein [Agarilytica sp.]
MDDGLKQRLIGAFVLFALGVIFIPVIFDRDRIEPVDKRTQIPSAPYIEPVDVNASHSPVVKEIALPAEEIYLPDEAKEVSIEPENHSVTPEGVPNSWVLQTGSFRYIKHAEQFRDTLIKEGYSAYIRTATTEKGKMTRVYVGPKLDKNILIKQKKEIEKKHNTTAMLLKFEP